MDLRETVFEAIARAEAAVPAYDDLRETIFEAIARAQAVVHLSKRTRARSRLLREQAATLRDVELELLDLHRPWRRPGTFNGGQRG